VDSEERRIDFREADRRYAELKRQHDAGTIDDEEFDAQRQRLMVQDDEGRWWAKFGKSGEWHYRDGVTWTRGTPPGYRAAVPEPATDDSPVQAPSPSRPNPKGGENGKNGRRRVPFWIPLAGLAGIALVGIVLIVWVLVPYLRGELTSNEATLGAVFVHRATPENISANSTYLDNSQTNDEPSVILYVTPNYNPGGGSGTYNDHPIGVWYDSSTQRWAIFNQDREAMPEGAAFNVAVLEEPTVAR
jgi:hypothetical protein